MPPHLTALKRYGWTALNVLLCVWLAPWVLLCWFSEGLDPDERK
jgi:hypothetical protein